MRQRTAKRSLGLLVGALLLAACQTTGTTTPLKSAAEPAGPVPVPAIRLAMGHDGGSLKDVTPDELPPPTPANLIGLTPSRLVNALGEPDFRRTDRNAALWHYAGPDCFLDLYLYRKAQGDYAVSHVEFRSRNVSQIDTNACFSSVLAHHYAKRT